jgi:hypothetical protein
MVAPTPVLTMGVRSTSRLPDPKEKQPERAAASSATAARSQNLWSDWQCMVTGASPTVVHLAVVQEPCEPICEKVFGPEIRRLRALPARGLRGRERAGEGNSTAQYW